MLKIHHKIRGPDAAMSRSQWMTKPSIDRAAAARAEVEGVKFGDVRLTRRAGNVVGKFAVRPDRSLPDIFTDSSELEASYRFLGNPSVSSRAILKPHVDKTVARCSGVARPLAIMDTTEVRFGGERDELGYLTNEKGRGVYTHLSLAVVPGTRECLGVLHSETWARHGEMKRRKAAAGKEDSESLRWNHGAEVAFELLPNAICVMDREADIFSLVDEMYERSQDFVIRAAQNRATPDGLLWTLLDDTEKISSRAIFLPKRKPRHRKSERELHPPRVAHTAQLELRVRRVTLIEPGKNSPQKIDGAKKDDVNLVHVIERNPPKGCSPIEWKLLTSLPVESADDVDFIVDSYAARWVIEEFFKALKTGCSLEKRQLESVHSVENMIAISLLVAWLLLRLRHLSRDAPDEIAGKILTPLMMLCLRALLLERKRKPLPANPTNKELVWAIAGIGGHITNNGEPGFQVLGRGLTHLLEATAVVDRLREMGEM